MGGAVDSQETSIRIRYLLIGISDAVEVEVEGGEPDSFKSR